LRLRRPPNFSTPATHGQDLAIPRSDHLTLKSRYRNVLPLTADEIVNDDSASTDARERRASPQERYGEAG
jgi:hypothetical protein